MNPHLREVLLKLIDQKEADDFEYDGIGSRLLSQPSNIGNVTVSNLTCRDLEDEDVFELLRTHTSLTCLNLESDDITPNGIAGISSSTTLRKLILCSNHVGNLGISYLASNTTLTFLDVENCQPFKSPSVLALAANTTLKHLSIGTMKYDSNKTKAVEALVFNTSLRSFRSSGGLSASEINLFASTTSLTSLGLAGCMVFGGSVGLLLSNTALKSLDISSNLFQMNSLVSINLNTSLRSLVLQRNAVGREDVKALALNTTMTSLDLKSCRIGDEASRLFRYNTTLICLNLQDCDIRDGGATELADNTTLIDLDLADNHIGFDEPPVAVAALARNNTLKRLNLSFNKITLEDVKALACNTRLLFLKLGSGIGFEGTKILKEMVTSRNQLSKLPSLFNLALTACANFKSNLENIPGEIVDDYELMIYECSMCQRPCVPNVYLELETHEITPIEMCSRCMNKRLMSER